MSARTQMWDGNQWVPMGNSLLGSSNISFAGNDSSAGVATPTLTWPATEDGDYAFSFECMRNTTSTGPDAAVGWTELHKQDSSSNEWMQVYYMELDGTETGDIDYNTAAVTNTVGLIVMRGIDTTDPIYQSTANGDAAGPDNDGGNSLANGYSIHWFMNCFNGTADPEIGVNISQPLTVLVSDDNLNDTQIMVAGRDSGLTYQTPERATGWASTTYNSYGIISLRSL